MRLYIGIALILLSSTLMGGNLVIDKANSYHVATIVDSAVYRNNYYQPRYNRLYYNNGRYYKKRRYYKKKRYSRKQYVAPRMTDEKRIQKALGGLGFYSGRIDGTINSYETRTAIKKMNIALGVGDTASLDPNMKHNLIFLGRLFIFDRDLISTSNTNHAKYKKIQTALKIHGFYHDRIDGIVGSGTRKAISGYKWNSGLSSDTSLSYEQEYQLIESAKKANDKNIEGTIESLRNTHTQSTTKPGYQ